MVNGEVVTASRSPAIVEILLIEDNPGDVKITVEAFRDAKVSARVHTVENGEDALRYLRGQPPYIDQGTPNLVVLDLNLPTVSGYDVLIAMKADERLKSIPVLVISSSENPADVNRAYANQASVYLKKPVDLDQYFTMVRAIKDIWFRFAMLPAAEASRSASCS